jgi:O-antigen/teichoic acid export membrane protein
LNVIISYYLITDYFPAEHASAGAACGTVISLSIFNILKTLFVYIKFKLFPLSKSTGVILLAFLIGLAITYGLNFDFSPYVNIVLKSAIICLCYFIPIYLIKEVPDVNQLLKSYWTKMKALY